MEGDSCVTYMKEQEVQVAIVMRREYIKVSNSLIIMLIHDLIYCLLSKMYYPDPPAT